MLTFNLLGFDVRVHLTFLLVLAFVVDSQLPFVPMLLWAAAVFVSVLIHELGHALMARRYGARVEGILIYALGGFTSFHDCAGMDRTRRVAVSAAGSGYALSAGMIVYLLSQLGLFGATARSLATSPWSEGFWIAGYLGDELAFFMLAFVWVSVFWSLINWLPIGGLDGGYIFREIMVKISPVSGATHAKIIGLITAIVVGLILAQRGYRFAPVLFIWFAIADLLNQSPRDSRAM